MYVVKDLDIPSKGGIDLTGKSNVDIWSHLLLFEYNLSLGDY